MADLFNSDESQDPLNKISFISAQPQPKKKMGRPSKYNTTIPNLLQVQKMAEKGFTNYEFADLFGVALSTWNKWMECHKDFADSVKRGRDQADKKVEQALYKRATGYSHPHTEVFCNRGEIITQDIVKHYPPDPLSIFYWLNNRKSLEWRQKSHQEITGNLNNQLIIQVQTNEQATQLNNAINAIAPELPEPENK